MAFRSRRRIQRRVRLLLLAAALLAGTVLAFIGSLRIQPLFIICLVFATAFAVVAPAAVRYHR